MVSVRHRRITSNMTVLKEVQNRDWQYLINPLIEKVERAKSLKVKTTKESKLIAAMEKTVVS